MRRRALLSSPSCRSKNRRLFSLCVRGMSAKAYSLIIGTMAVLRGYLLCVITGRFSGHEDKVFQASCAVVLPRLFILPSPGLASYDTPPFREQQRTHSYRTQAVSAPIWSRFTNLGESDEFLRDSDDLYNCCVR